MLIWPLVARVWPDTPKHWSISRILSDIFAFSPICVACVLCIVSCGDLEVKGVCCDVNVNLSVLILQDTCARDGSCMRRLRGYRHLTFDTRLCLGLCWQPRPIRNIILLWRTNFVKFCNSRPQGSNRADPGHTMAAIIIRAEVISTWDHKQRGPMGGRDHRLAANQSPCLGQSLVCDKPRDIWDNYHSNL